MSVPQETVREKSAWVGTDPGRGLHVRTSYRSSPSGERAARNSWWTSPSSIGRTPARTRTATRCRSDEVKPVMAGFFHIVSIKPLVRRAGSSETGGQHRPRRTDTDPDAPRSIMNILWIYAHPDESSLNAALRDEGLAVLAEAGHDHRVSDLYAMVVPRSEEHTSELQSRGHLVCRLLLEKKKHHRTD